MMSALQLNPDDLASFDTVYRQVQKRAEHNLPDKIVDLKKLTYLKSGNVYVPGLGVLEMNRWSKMQISNALGIDWDKWFRHASDQEVQEEILRRLNRSPQVYMVRSRRHFKAKAGSDGVLRAFLTPTYEAIDDVRVFDRMKAGFKDRLADMRFIKKRTQETDKSSHFTLITGDVFDGADPKADGKAGDPIYFGIKIRNSETGFSALTADDFTIRVRCLNGLISWLRNDRLMYRRHRHISDDDIDGMLTHMFGIIPAHQDQIKAQWAAARSVAFQSHEDAKAAIDRFLDRRKFPKKVIEAARVAYDQEPNPTGIGVLNAITAAARDITGDVDRRQDLEQAAGRYLMTLRG